MRLSARYAEKFLAKKYGESWADINSHDKKLIIDGWIAGFEFAHGFFTKPRKPIKPPVYDDDYFQFVGWLDKYG